MKALALAAVFFAAPLSAAPSVPAKADVKPSPTRAQLTERRNALLESFEGFRALSAAQGPAMAQAAARLESIRASLLKLPINPEIRAADALRALANGIETHRSMFDQWKQEFLASLYAGRNQGQELAAAAPEARESFVALVDKQADTLRELAHKPFIHGEQLAALRAQVLTAGSPAALDHVFDNDSARGGLPAMSLAAARTDAPAPFAVFERPFRAAPASFSPGPSAPTGFSAQPLARGIRDFQIDGAAPPAPRAAAPEAPGPLMGAAAKGDKRSWQLELLKRTGAWSVLTSVGVDPETFIRSLTGAESGYATDATSSAGAAGVMQVMPDTACGIMRGRAYRSVAAEYGLPVHRYSVDAQTGACKDGATRNAVQAMLNKEWRTNILLGILYLKDQADSFVGYAERARVSLEDKAKLMMNMVAGAYNAGPGRVWQALGRLRQQGISLAAVNPTQSLVRFRETQNYVKKILRDYGTRLFAETHDGVQPDRVRG